MLDDLRNNLIEFKDDVKAAWSNMIESSSANVVKTNINSKLSVSSVYTGRFKNISTDVLKDKLQNTKNISKACDVARFILGIATVALMITTLAGKPTAIPYLIVSTGLACSLALNFIYNSKINELEIEIKRREQGLTIEDGAVVDIQRGQNLELTHVEQRKNLPSTTTYGTQPTNP